jgi:hypothetical protein
MQTESLIETLEADARRAPRPALPPWPMVVVLVVGAAAITLFTALGVRPGFVASLASLRFDLKFILTGLTALAALLALRDLRHPGRSGRRWLPWLALPAALLGLAVVGELLAVPGNLWGARLVGTNNLVCLIAIPAMGAVPLAILLWALRRGATTRPLLAGGLCGLAAAAVSGFFYAAHCIDDSPLFVATWYPLAASMLVAAGMSLGRKVLRW